MFLGVRFRKPGGEKGLKVEPVAGVSLKLDRAQLAAASRDFSKCETHQGKATGFAVIESFRKITFKTS